ncbi:leucine-rich repeat domain-containing protein [Acinetobacter sp. ANC 3813]|uniref:leucine-rich repeat domain-containing protein n=1 Tax=Acinetobacter sp. ANC 3813 TaxID=1977873 RepID=UPI000A341922|nr:leucine-rich repeat domain-containing protein [Acinetobacter sp. ANC 3813]OTG87891.1 hypothetical protein B9T34_16280 [Acinetobacter sp. ANC 3813]
MTIAQKMQALASLKTQIMNAIKAKGAAIDASTPFSEYPQKITALASPDPAQGRATAVYGVSNTGITHVTVPSTATYISAGLFKNWALKEVVLPEGLLRIGGEAFSGCVELAVMNIPSTLTTIEYSALSGVIVPKVVIPASVTTLSSCLSSFGGREIIVQCALPIPSSFANGSKAVSVELNPNIKSIADNGFFNNPNLVNINLENIEYLDAYALAQCKELKEANLTSLKQAAASNFRGCSKLEKITFGNKLSHIPSVFLSDAYALKKLVLPAVSELSIANSAITGLSTLELLEIPAVKLSMSYFSITDMLVVKTIVIHAQTIPAISGSTANSGAPFTALTINNKTVKIYVRDELLEGYKTANGWSVIDPSCYYPLSSYVPA